MGDVTYQTFFAGMCARPFVLLTNGFQEINQGKPDEPPWAFAKCPPDPPSDYVGVTVW
jgi:hypothetical protein